MNVAVLQRIDRYLGVPLCALLTVVRWAADGVRKRTAYRRSGVQRGRAGDPSCTRHAGARLRNDTADLMGTGSGDGHEAGGAPRSVLVVKLAEQGSTVLAYPALRHAVAEVGAANVYFLLFAPNRFILDELALIPRANVVTLSVDGPLAFLRSVVAALRRLRALQIEACVDLEFFSRGSALLTFLSGARCRVGFHGFGHGPYRGDLMTHRIAYHPDEHTTDAFHRLVAAAFGDLNPVGRGLRTPPQRMEAPPSFYPREDERDRVRQLVFAGSDPAAPLILLNANASDLLPQRRWPMHRYVELARRLLLRFPEARIVLTGAPAEAAAIERLAAEIGSARCVPLAGRTTLRELLVLYTLARVLVTNDSGPAHFATLTPVAVVALFGPETPRLFGSRSPRTTNLTAALPCSPCVSALNQRTTSCRDNRCMQLIEVSTVFEAAVDAYNRRVVRHVEEPLLA